MMDATSSSENEAPVISKTLLDLLVCPVDKAPLTLSQSTLVCTVCGRRYPIEDGIPNMLVDSDQ
jgi:uncharacterized protein YbaR (Trm112 family)